MCTYTYAYAYTHAHAQHINTQKNATRTHKNTTRTYRTAFNPSVPRLHTDTLKYDGPGPNMRIKPTFHIDRPNRPSYAFIAASRAKAHVNPIL